MFVDAGTLHSGAAESHRAGSLADDGANHLARKSQVPEMFGDFATAEAFHEAVTQAHTQHTAKLRAHQETLSNLGDKARTVAEGFAEMDERNASKLKAMRCNCAT
jgi:Protein of unknown function (DUF2563)